jgi:hypothetical protein
MSCDVIVFCLKTAGGMGPAHGRHHHRQEQLGSLFTANVITIAQCLICPCVQLEAWDQRTGVITIAKNNQAPYLPPMSCPLRDV